jgi:hypothetical protein
MSGLAIEPPGRRERVARYINIYIMRKLTLWLLDWVLLACLILLISDQWVCCISWASIRGPQIFICVLQQEDEGLGVIDWDD